MLIRSRKKYRRQSRSNITITFLSKRTIRNIERNQRYNSKICPEIKDLNLSVVRIQPFLHILVKSVTLKIKKILLASSQKD